MKLAELLEGDFAKIAHCKNQRLEDNGLTKGTEFLIYKKLNSITCLYFKGAILACRDKDLENIKAYKITQI